MIKKLLKYFLFFRNSKIIFPKIQKKIAASRFLLNVLCVAVLLMARVRSITVMFMLNVMAVASV